METIELPMADVLKVCCGKDDLGYPRAAGAISIVKQEKNDWKVVDNIMMKNAVFQIYSQGGCAVIVAQFPKDSMFEYRRACELCENWLKTLDDPELQVFSCILVPYSLVGYIELAFNYLVYSSKADTEKMELVMAFSTIGNGAIAVESETTDYNMIIAEIDSELRKQENELDEELELAKQAEEEAKRDNPYSEAIKDMFGNMEEKSDE